VLTTITPKETDQSILDVAQRLIQSRGYNGFSYKDVAAALGIRTASIHYHFATKADLGVALASRHRRNFQEELERISGETDDPMRRLEQFTDLFRSTFAVESRLCLCGMLSAEIATLPEPVAAEVENFFRDTERWLSGVLTAGKKAKSLRFIVTPRKQARLLLSVLEGAMVVARGMRDSAGFNGIAAGYLRNFKPF
jgi:TetR/AcrR family transcriptional repressor of nem operon